MGRSCKKKTLEGSAIAKDSAVKCYPDNDKQRDIEDFISCVIQYTVIQ
jgi:hypothetical protein